MRNLRKIPVLFLLISALLAGCASSLPPTDREPAQASALDLESEFQAYWNSADPIQVLVMKVNRLVALYLRAQKILGDFDEEQKGDLSPLTSSEAYTKLQVLRVMQDDLTERVAFIYGRLVEMEQSQNPEEVKRSQKILSMFSRFMLLNRNTFKRLAMQNLVSELREIRKQKSAKATGFDGIEFSSAAEIVSFLDAKENETGRREALAAAAQKEAANRDAEFEGNLHEFKSAMAAPQRDPQAVAFFPGAGRSGNIWGHELPMGTFALTFDDGPHKKWTPLILNALRENRQKASFFWLAKNLENHGMDEIVYNAKKAGHTLGNHSFTHADLNKSDAALAKLGTDLHHEIVDSTAVDKAIYGTKPSYFRCPYGACIFKDNPRVRKMIAEQRMLHVTWTIDSLDWQDKDPASVYNRVVKAVEKHGRGIILFHDVHAQSFEASSALMKYFRGRRNDYRLRTISEVVRELNELPQNEEPPPLLRWLPLPWGQSN